MPYTNMIWDHPFFQPLVIRKVTKALKMNTIFQTLFITKERTIAHEQCDKDRLQVN